MNLPRGRAHSGRGQMLVLFAISLSVIVMGVGLVIDGGNALVQRRGSQNASDFAALAGARVIAEFIDGDLGNGTDNNVRLAITNALATNSALPVTFSAPDGPRYIDANGGLLGYVGTGAIPPTAVGVKVASERTWKPYFLGIVGMTSWTATTEATAKGGYSQAGPPPGSLFPVGISHLVLQHLPVLFGPDQHQSRRRLLSAAPDAGQPQRPGWFRLAEVRLRWLRPRPGPAAECRRLQQRQALPSGRDRAAEQELWLLHRDRRAWKPRPHR